MKAGSSLRASRNGAAVLTQEQLATLLASYKTPEQAQGEYNVYVIEEVTPAYTLTSGENWKKTIDDLPRHDEEGNEYTYYVVETSPATGYITTYDGENSGLTDKGKVTSKLRSKRN